MQAQGAYASRRGHGQKIDRPIQSEAMDANQQIDRPPVVLQVLPSLVTGGVERGTIEITQAIAEADAVALVASAGGRMVTSVERAGGRHITLPLLSRDPLTIWRNA